MVQVVSQEYNRDGSDFLSLEDVIELNALSPGFIGGGLPVLENRFAGHSAPQRPGG